MNLRFKKYFAELLGTALFVFFSCGAVMAVGIDYKKGTAYLISALAAFLAFVAMSCSISRISGCHLNPAVSLSMLITRKIDIWDFVGYVISQCAGAFAGVGLLTAIFWGHTGNYGANVYYNADPFVSLLVEALFALTFVSVFLFTDKDKNSGIYKGLALFLTNILGIQLTGASVNPAKSLACAILAGGDFVGEVWVFIVAPLLGGAFAALLYMLFSDSEKVDGEDGKEYESEQTIECLSEEDSEKTEETEENL